MPWQPGPRSLRSAVKMAASQATDQRSHATIKPVTDPADAILSAIRRCNDPKDPLGVVEADEIIQDELLKRGDAHFENVMWRELSFHWVNRSGSLASPAEVVTLMEDVDHVGVSTKALGHALCSEAEPGNGYSEQKTREWVEKSPYPMAAVVPGTIRFQTLSRSHFTQGVRSILAGVANTNEQLGDGKNYSADVPGSSPGTLCGSRAWLAAWVARSPPSSV